MAKARGRAASTQVVRMGDFDVAVTRKRVRNINLRVHRDGTVVVSAPQRVPLSEIERFVQSKYAWIARARRRQMQQTDRMSLDCSPGATVFVWGQELTCTLDQDASGMTRRSWDFEIAGDKLLVRPSMSATSRESSFEEGGRRLDAWLRRQLSQRVQELLPHWQQVVGRQCSAIRLRSMKSRWGSCNVKTSAITLNTHLVHFDGRCLEYVLCHELCHLHEPSHNARFHALMDQFYPGWQRTRALLAGT